VEKPDHNKVVEGECDDLKKKAIDSLKAVSQKQLNALIAKGGSDSEINKLTAIVGLMLKNKVELIEQTDLLT